MTLPPLVPKRSTAVSKIKLGIYLVCVLNIFKFLKENIWLLCNLQQIARSLSFTLRVLMLKRVAKNKIENFGQWVQRIPQGSRGSYEAINEADVKDDVHYSLHTCSLYSKLISLSCKTVDTNAKRRGPATASGWSRMRPTFPLESPWRIWSSSPRAQGAALGSLSW